MDRLPFSLVVLRQAAHSFESRPAPAEAHQAFYRRDEKRIAEAKRVLHDSL
jgi:hypothetical protein